MKIFSQLLFKLRSRFKCLNINKSSNIPLQNIEANLINLLLTITHFPKKKQKIIAKRIVKQQNTQKKADIK